MKKITLVAILVFSIFNSYSQENKTTHYYKNNLTLKPFNINSIGVGVGLQYERYLDNTNNFSFVIPFDYSFEVSNANNYGLNNSDNYGINTNPGLRFYFVEPRKFNWYLGCSFLLGYENAAYTYYDINGNQINTRATRKSFGSMINAGFKGTIKDRFTYNLEVGNGIKFIDKYDQNTYALYNSSRYLGSILVGFGYNF